MRDVPVPAAPRPSLLRRVRTRWHEARAAALLRSLPPAEVGLDNPAPATLVPRAHAALAPFAHPAVTEVGVPATLAMIGIALWQQGWDVYWPAHPVPFTLFLLFHPLWVLMATGVGQVMFRRRYLRMAREAYQSLRWRALDVGSAEGTPPEAAPPVPALAESADA